MFRVFTCLTGEHDWRLVALAGVVCFIASLAAVNIFHRAIASQGRTRVIWIAIAGGAIGYGIWATHFIAMLAYEPGVATGYGIVLTALSLGTSLLLTSSGFSFAANNPTRWGTPIGGAAMGAGIVSMHYLGMLALEVPGRVTWSLDLVFASIIVGMFFGIAALVIAVRYLDRWGTFAAALFLTLAIVSHHFTAMAAIEIIPDPTRIPNALSLSPGVLALAISGVALSVLGMSLIGAFADRRLVTQTRKFEKIIRRLSDAQQEIEASQRQLHEQKVQLDTALENMSQGLTMFDSAGNLVVCNDRYRQIYRLSPDLAKPGCTFLDLLRSHTAKGIFSVNPEEYVANLLASIARGEKLNREVETGDGRVLSIVTMPMADGAWVATHEDITEAKRQQASFRLLFENNPVPMWVYDVNSLRFLAVNDSALVHYGYSREQFLAMTSADIRPPEEHERFKQFVRATGGAHDGQQTWRHQKSDGTEINVVVYARRLSYDGHEAALIAAIDVTERMRTEEELHRTQKFLDTVIDHVPVSIIVKDAPSAAKDARDLRFTLINRTCEELFGVSRQDIIGKTADEVYPEELADFVVAHDNETLKLDQAVHVCENLLVTPHNGTRLTTAKKVNIRNDDGSSQYLLTVLEDITERKESENRITHLAHHDTLTELPNRAHFNNVMNTVLDRAAATGEQFSILSIDLDHFKEANDRYGHLVGDILLREVARRLKDVAKGTFVARIGGDEFVAIVTEGVQPAAALTLAQRLIDAFADDFEIESRRMKLGLSIGGAVYPTDGVDAKTLLINADTALYRTKLEIRGSVLFFEPEMDRQQRERRALQEDLRSALNCGELFLHYQPQQKMSGETVGFEALVRWKHPTRGTVPPGTFIPIAEEGGLIIPMGEWVLREACREAASWRQPLTIAVNISAIQFRHGDLPRLVHSILLETGLAPGRLELEITESVLIDDFSRAKSILNQFKSLGVRIAMDDFGTGYSSLSYLQSFNFDKIKIDRTFVCDLEHNRHSMAIVRAVIGLGRSLDLPILAEGVETKAQHAFLLQEGCDEVQGYLTGRPLPIADYAELIGRQAIAQHNYAAAG
jgi:diguanylate cyclase (GGDEF)-like protein/PAS domain S-box-containing protein